MVTGVGDATVTVNFTTVGAAETVELFGYLPEDTNPISFGTRVGPGDIVKAGLINYRIYGLLGLNKTSGGFFGPPSKTIFLMPVDADDAAGDVLPRAIDRIKTAYIDSANVLGWINAYNIGETTDGHVFLGHDPSEIEDLPTKGPVFAISATDIGFENTGQNTSFSGDVLIVVRHFWHDPRETPNQHMQAYNFLWKTIREILRLDPLEATHGLSIESVEGFVTQPWDESEDIYFSEIGFRVALGLDL